MITISEEAKQKILEVLKDKPNAVARIVLKKGGCAGNILSLILDEPNNTDVVIEVDDIKFVVSPEIQNYIQDVSIELKQSLGTEIIIRNNKAPTCRCGKSFKI